jgi:hypothetical protein
MENKNENLNDIGSGIRKDWHPDLMGSEIRQ